MHPYILGIIWALGRYVDRAENPNYRYFFFRHNRDYFLKIVRQELGVKNNIYTILRKGKIQYQLKAPDINIATLERLGWSPRWAEQRNYPNIIEHQDFIRAYLEIHGRLDTIIIRKRKSSQKQPRLRIYGNRYFLEELSEVLSAHAGLGVKKVQKTTNESEVSGILYYQSRSELKALLEYLYPPGIQYFDREWYEKFKEIVYH